MQSIDSIEQAVNELRAFPFPLLFLNAQLCILPPEIVSLKGVNELKDAYPDAIVGFSDHSIGSEMALAAVALGASIIERHFTDTRYRAGPDISCSSDPAELRKLIQYSTEIHTALHNNKERSVPEEDVYRFARASVVTDKNIKKGDAFTHENLWVRRPGTGEIPAADYDNIIGRYAARELKAGMQLKFSDVQVDEE